AISSFPFTALPTTSIFTLSLHDALPISQCTTRTVVLGLSRVCFSRGAGSGSRLRQLIHERAGKLGFLVELAGIAQGHAEGVEERSEEHTSELQSLRHLVCRLLLEKKNKK